VHCIL